MGSPNASQLGLITVIYFAGIKDFTLGKEGLS